MAETTFTVKIAVQEDGSISLIDQAGEKIASLGQAASGAKAGLSTLEAGTKAAGSAAQASGGQVGEFGNKAGELGSKAQSATGGLSSMASSLLSLNAAVELSKTAFEIGSRAVDAFFSGVDRADNLNDLSQKIGVSVSTLSAFELAANTAGTSIEGVGNGFKVLSKNLSEASAGNTAMADSFKQVLGASFDVNEGLSDTNSTMLALADAFAGMEDGGRKTALAMEVLGKSGADLIPFLNQGSEEITRLTTLSERLGAVISEDTAAAADAFNDNLAILGTAVTGVGTQIAASMLPALKDLTDTIVDFVANDSTVAAFSATFSSAMKAMSAGVQKIADDLKNLGEGATLSQRLEVIFRDVTPTVISVGGQLAKALWSGFVSVAVSIWNSMDWVDIISTGIFIAIGGPAGGALAFIGHAILEGITGGAVAKAPESAAQIVDSLATELKDNAGQAAPMISDGVFVAMLGGGAALAANLLTGPMQALGASIVASLGVAIGTGGVAVVSAALAAVVVGGIGLAFGSDAQGAWNSQLAQLVNSGADTVRSEVEAKRDLLEVKLKASIEFDATDMSGETARLKLELDKANAALEKTATVSAIAEANGISYAEALKQVNSGTTAVSAAVDKEAEALKRKEEAQKQAQAVMDGYVSKLNEIKTATEATTSFYTQLNATPVNSDRYVAISQEKEIYDQLVTTLGTVEAAQASMAAQDAAYQAASEAVASKRSQSSAVYVNDLRTQAQAEADHVAAMKIAADQYGVTGQTQSAVAAIIEESSLRILGATEQEAAAIRTAAEGKIQAVISGQTYADQLTQQTEAEKAQMDAVNKNSEAITAHATAIQGLSTVGQIWQYAADGAISYGDAERAATAAASASTDVFDQAAAVRMRLVEVTVQQTNENLKAAAASQQNQVNLQAEIAAIDAAESSGVSYANSTLEIERAKILAAAATQKAADSTIAETAALNESIDKLAQSKINELELAAAAKQRMAVYQARSQITALKEETAIWAQVKSGVMSVSAAEHELAVRQKEVELGSRTLAEEFVTAQETMQKTAESAKNAYIDLGQVLEGAFTQAFDAVISGTRDLGDVLEGMGLSIGKQIFSAMLKSKFSDFDPTMKANFLDLGQFGESTFGKMFSSVIEGGKSLLGLGSSGSSGGSTAGSGEPIGQNADGSYIFSNPEAAKQAGSSFLADFMVGMGVGSFTKQATDSLRGGPSSTGSNGWDQVLQFQNMASTGLAQALGGPLAAAIVGVFNSFLPDIVKMFRDAFDTTTKGTKERVKGESDLDKSPTFSKLQDKSNLGDFTRGDNKDLGLFDNYRTGVATAIERGMKEGEANAIKGAGEGIFSVIFKGDGDKMVNGAMDMGRGMAEFLSRGLADGMTYDEMLASLRSFADENDVTLKDALIGVNTFGKAAIEQFGKIGQADWGAQEFADSIYGITEIFQEDVPHGVSLASIALQSMSKDGASAFGNLDAAGKQWLVSLGNDAEAFKTVMADLASQGFTIDTTAFENKMADMTASAMKLGEVIPDFINSDNLVSAFDNLGSKLATSVSAALASSMLKDMNENSDFMGSLEGVFGKIRELQSGDLSQSDFMAQLPAALAEGRANLDEYIPRLKAIRAAVKEVQDAVVEAFKPDAAERLAASIQAAADGLKGSFYNAINAGMDAALGDGGSTAAGMNAFAESMRGSIKDSVKQSIMQGIAEAAMMKGPLAELMGSFGEAFQGALAGGISSDEQAYLDALLGQIGTVADQTIAYLSPSVEAVLKLGEAADTTIGKMNTRTVGVPTDPVVAQFKKDVAEAQATLQSGFSSAVSAAFSAIGEGKSVSEATAAFSESFKTSISQSVAAGLQEALVQSAVMEGALGGLMATFKQATAAAMADGVITGAEQAQLAGLAQQIKTTGEAAANALAPVVASVATIATGVTSGAGDVQFAVNTQAQMTATQADAAMATSATAATTTVAAATETAATTLADAATTMAANLSDALGTTGASSSESLASEAQAQELVMRDAMAQAGTAISNGATISGAEYQQLMTTASQVIGAAVTQGSADSSATLTTAYQEAAAAAQEALGTAGEALSGDVTDAANSLRDSVSEILGTSDSISQIAPEAAYGIGQSLADVREKVAPEMQSQIDSMIAALSDASLTPEESAALSSTFDALSESVSPDAASTIAGGIDALKAQLDAGRLSSITDPLSDALGSLTSPSDSVRSALDRMVNPTETATNRMQDLGYAVEKAVAAINGAAGSIRSGGTPAAASGGTFARGSAVVGEAGSPELVTANRGGGFSVHPLTWPEAKHLMRGGTPGMAVGGVVGGGTLGGDGGNTVPPAPVPTGGGYSPGAEGAEFADFTGAITDAFRAGFEGSKGFIEDFSDSINEAVRTRLVDAIMQGFAESPAIQQYAENIDTLITKAQELAGNNKLSAEELANIQAQIKQNTDAIGAQADQIDELLEPMRQAEAISTAISDGLDFSGALKSLALNPDDIEGFSKSIDETVNDAVLNGAIQGLLASGPIQDAVKKFGDTMNDAMATALEDGILTAEESDALHDLAVTGSEEMKTAMEALAPVLAALGIDLGDSLSEGVNRAKETMKTASSAMDPFAALGEGETQFGNFTQSIRDQVYGNIKDGLIQAFIDSAVTQGLLAGPMMAIQSIFDQIGQKQLTTAEANAKLAEQVALINGSLNDPAFKSAFDTTMASISTIGQSLGQSSKAVVESAATSREVVQAATKDVCGGKCELEKRTAELGFASVNTFGRQASVSVEQMLPKLAGGGLVRERTTAIIGEAGPELVIPVRDLATPSNIQRLADIASAAAPSAGAPSTVQLDVDRMAKGADNTVDAIERLHDRLDKLSDAILAQPTEVNVQMDRETLMRAMAKADRFKKKARYGVTA